MAVSSLVKSIQNIMRQDTGVDGDAQRIGQLCWMFFLKIIDDQDRELEMMRADYASPIPQQFQWRAWAADPEGITGESLLTFVDDDLFPALKSLRMTGLPGDRRRVVQDVFEDAHNYMKSGQLMRQVINKINGIDFNDLSERQHFGDIYEQISQRSAIGGERRRVLHAARRHRLHGRPYRPEARRDPVRPRLRHRRLPHLFAEPHARTLCEAARGRADHAGSATRR